MPTIKERIQKDETVFCFESDSARHGFIAEASREGLKWKNGNLVLPTDECWFFVLIKSDFTLANIPSFAREKYLSDAITYNPTD